MLTSLQTCVIWMLPTQLLDKQCVTLVLNATICACNRLPLGCTIHRWQFRMQMCSRDKSTKMRLPGESQGVGTRKIKVNLVDRVRRTFQFIPLISFLSNHFGGKDSSSPFEVTEVRGGGPRWTWTWCIFPAWSASLLASAQPSPAQQADWDSTALGQHCAGTGLCWQLSLLPLSQGLPWWTTCGHSSATGSWIAPFHDKILFFPTILVWELD